MHFPKGRLQKKKRKFWGFVSIRFDPHPPPLLWDKKIWDILFRIWTPSLLRKFGTKGAKKFQDKVTIVKQYSVILLDTLAHVLISYHF